MEQKNKILPYVLFGIPLLIGGYFVFKALKDKASKGKEQDVNDQTKKDDVIVKKDGKVAPAIQQFFPLKKGSKGAKVKELQDAILSYNATLLPKYGNDSDFGSETEVAVNKILGKKSVDSQDEITKILGMKNTAANNAAVALANTNRASLANKLVSAYKANPIWLNFYAIYATSGEFGHITSDGRYISSGSKSYSNGAKIPLTRSAKFNISAQGFITAIDGGNYWSFSPYAFEVK